MKHLHQTTAPAALAVSAMAATTALARPNLLGGSEMSFNDFDQIDIDGGTAYLFKNDGAPALIIAEASTPTLIAFVEDDVLILHRGTIVNLFAVVDETRAEALFDIIAINPLIGASTDVVETMTCRTDCPSLLAAYNAIVAGECLDIENFATVAARTLKDIGAAVSSASKNAAGKFHGEMGQVVSTDQAFNIKRGSTTDFVSRHAMPKKRGTGALRRLGQPGTAEAARQARRRGHFRAQ